MPKINYFIDGGLGMRTSISKSGDDLEITVTPPKDGYIKANSTVYRVKYGNVTIPISELKDGEYSLRLETEGEGFALEKFHKSGADISPGVTDEETVRRLLVTMLKDRQRISTLEEKLSALLKRTEGHHIFN